MEIKLTGKKIFGCITAMSLLAVILWAGTTGDGLATVLAFIKELSTFIIQAVLVIGAALLMVFIANYIRSREWYDAHGAGTELSKVRNRMSTNDEQPGDARACAVQFLASSILIAVMILSFFLIHG